MHHAGGAADSEIQGEGIITLVLAVSMWIWYPNDPSKTRLFNEEERKLWLARFLVDQPAVCLLPGLFRL